MEPEKENEKWTAENDKTEYDKTEDEEKFNPMISLASLRREIGGVMLERQGTIRGRKL